jgi:hypothetical protein
MVAQIRLTHRSGFASGLVGCCANSPLYTTGLPHRFAWGAAKPEQWRTAQLRRPRLRPEGLHPIFQHSDSFAASPSHMTRRVGLEQSDDPPPIINTAENSPWDWWVAAQTHPTSLACHADSRRTRRSRNNDAPRGCVDLASARRAQTGQSFSRSPWECRHTAPR